MAGRVEGFRWFNPTFLEDFVNFMQSLGKNEQIGLEWIPLDNLYPLFQDFWFWPEKYT